MSDRIPNVYQAAVFEEIDKGLDGPHLVVKAVAGSGKTWTIKQGARRTDVPGTFVAFNRPIARELKKDLKGTAMAAQTLHSVGLQSLPRLNGVQYDPEKGGNKYRDLAETWAEEKLFGADRATQRSEARDLTQLASFVRKTLTPPNDKDAILKMCVHYALTPSDQVIDAIPDILAKGTEMARAGLIDFDDMLYLPHIWQTKLKQTPWVFVDEAQDLSASMLELARRLVADGGRMIAVGDDRQAIYGFTGADNESIKRIIEKTDAKTMPLSICYRCPTSHIKLAQTIEPTIQARPDAPEGTLEYVPVGYTSDHAKPGDMILCRLTAPLIKECLDMIRKEKPALVEGSAIGTQFTNILDTVSGKPTFTFRDLPKYLEEYRTKRVQKLVSRRADESLIESVNDQVDAIQACVEGFDAKTMAELKRRIKALFKEERPHVKLSTVHRAKGLQAETVYIIRPDALPLVWTGQLPWQFEQEKNLEYVAYTRGKANLFIEGLPPDDTQSEPVPEEKPKQLELITVQASAPEPGTIREWVLLADKLAREAIQTCLSREFEGVAA